MPLSGSGYYEYKAELGGVPVEYYRVSAFSPNTHGRVAGIALICAETTRDWLRPAGRDLRGLARLVRVFNGCVGMVW